MTKDQAPFLFSRHPRRWESNRFVYPVLSRRSRGLSIGINLNPDARCNFDCVYCSVDRSVYKNSDPGIDPEQIRIELKELLQEVRSENLWTLYPFNRTPVSLRRLNDVAFSGNGEPTTCRQLPAICQLVREILHQASFPEVKIILITNATLLHKSHAIQVLDYLKPNHDEIWAKLDAGTESYYRMIDRTSVPLQRILNNILYTGRQHRITIQSMFIRFNGQIISPDELEAYLMRLQWLNDNGCRIRLVQAYTVARPTACNTVLPVSSQILDSIVARIRKIGLQADAYYAPGDEQIDS